MSDASSNVLSPDIVHREMKQNGVTDVVWLPDSETNWLYLLMKADPDLRLVGVSREGHACSIAAGLSAGGRKPIILIQNTGMMESGDSIRGWLMGLATQPRFPFGTLAVNVLGCALIGVFAAFAEAIPSLNGPARLLLVTGLLGGFTTFSAFGLETVLMLRRGDTALAAAYVVASLVLGLIAVWIGMKAIALPR